MQLALKEARGRGGKRVYLVARALVFPKTWVPEDRGVRSAGTVRLLFMSCTFKRLQASEVMKLCFKRNDGSAVTDRFNRIFRLLRFLD